MENRWTLHSTPLPWTGIPPLSPGCAEISIKRWKMLFSMENSHRGEPEPCWDEESPLQDLEGFWWPRPVAKSHPGSPAGTTLRPKVALSSLLGNPCVFFLFRERNHKSKEAGWVFLGLKCPNLGLKSLSPRSNPSRLPLCTT